jgi:hypothetical protein
MSVRNQAIGLVGVIGLATASVAGAQQTEGIPAAPEAAQSAGEPTAPLQQNSPTHTPTDSDEAGPEGPVASTTGPLDVAWINDQKIDQFATAYVEVRNIQNNAAAQLQTAPDPAKADAVKSEAASAMIAAVERSGLQIDEFNQIVQAAAVDDNVRSRLDAKIQERAPTGATTPEQSQTPAQ